MNSDYDVLIWGGKKKNSCQEFDLLESIINQDKSCIIYNDKQKHDCNAKKIIIRNMFYSSIKDFSNYEDNDSVKNLRELEKEGKIINSIDGLVMVRDKFLMNDIFEELDVPHIRTYKLESDSRFLLDWINETERRSNNGVIIKDRFGGLGKGIVKVKKQGSFYLADISCVEDFQQKYINETFTANELKEVFNKYLCDYDLIGQPYIPSSYEFSNPGESESIRVIDIGGKDFLSMRRIAQSPINNMSLTKNNIRSGGVEKTYTSEQEKWVSKKITEKLGLFLVGYDFIRTEQGFFDNEDAIFIPKSMKNDKEISVVLEVNGLLQYGGIQELYSEECNISDLVAKHLIDI